MNYYIVEDQQDARELILKYVETDFPQLKLIGYSEQYSEALAAIQKLKPDLLLLDINLGRHSAFELLDQLKEGINGYAPLILFISAYVDSETILKAFEYFPLRYITKPIDHQKMQISIDQTIHQFNLHRESIHNKIPLRPFQINKIRIPKIKGEVELLELENILFLQSANEGQTTKIFSTQELRFINSTKHLGYYKDLLKEYKQIFTASQSMIANLNYLKSYNHSNKTIWLHQYHEALIASRRGGEELKRWLCGE
ncbi:MAG: response regulator [Saprospiraceae bacterium]|nr:response regulator [Saprospiraceae bacterium]